MSNKKTDTSTKLANLSIVLPLIPIIILIITWIIVFILSAGSTSALSGVINGFFLMMPLFSLMGIGSISIGLVALRKMYNLDERQQRKNIAITGIALGGLVTIISLYISATITIPAILG